MLILKHIYHKAFLLYVAQQIKILCTGTAIDDHEICKHKLKINISTSTHNLWK